MLCCLSASQPALRFYETTTHNLSGGEIAKFALLVAAAPLPPPLKLGWPRDIIDFSLSTKKQDQKLLYDLGNWRRKVREGEVPLPPQHVKLHGIFPWCCATSARYLKQAILRSSDLGPEHMRLSTFAQTPGHEALASTKYHPVLGLCCYTRPQPKCLMHRRDLNKSGLCSQGGCGAGFVVFRMLGLQPLQESFVAANTVLAILPLFIASRALSPRAASRGGDRSQTMDMVFWDKRKTT